MGLIRTNISICLKGCILHQQTRSVAGCFGCDTRHAICYRQLARHHRTGSGLSRAAHRGIRQRRIPAHVQSRSGGRITGDHCIREDTTVSYPHRIT
ncbi:hypothetical protein RQX08_004418, partial [Salmonella enterica]|nr:hypothetical protein [Salmonella enterica]ELT9229230.1 hypothetical protein [Salmonella enterica]